MVAFGPPLIISAGEVDKILDIFEECLAEVQQSLATERLLSNRPRSVGRAS
jgi:hypothetical protein